jgi:Tfp pilus assembly protein PilO
VFFYRTLIYYSTIVTSSEALMEFRSKSNNYVAILIAVMLIAMGFALAFIHKQSKSDEQKEQLKVTITASSESASEFPKPNV